MALPIPYGQAFQIALVVVAIICIACYAIAKKDRRDPNRGLWMAIFIMTLIIFIALLIAYAWQYSSGWME
jgi:H+/Cl- antiporter ClcA